MSDVAFLVGREVVAVEPDGGGGARIVFELGERPEPELYADVGPPSYTAGEGKAYSLAEMVGSVVSAASTDEGTLVLSFVDGRTLKCEPHPDYEAWQVVGGTPQNLVVCLPGGELAVWDSSYVPTAKEAQETLDLLNEVTGWNARVQRITDTGGIIVEPVSDE